MRFTDKIRLENNKNKKINNAIKKISVAEMYFICSTIVFIILLILAEFNITSVNMWKITTVIICVLNCVLSYISEKNMTFIVVFNATYMLFLSGLVMADLIGNINFAQTNFFTGYMFNSNIQVEALKYIIVGSLGLNFGYVIYSMCKNGGKRKSKLKENFIEKFNIDFTFIGIVLMAIGILPNVFNIYRRISISKEHGYTALFNTELVNSYSIPLSGLIPIFTIGVYMILSTSKNKKTIITTIAIQILIIVLSLLTGERAVAFSQILTIIVYIALKFSVKIRVRDIIVIGLILGILGQIISYSRIGEIENNNIFNKLVDFIGSQGVAIHVVMYTIEHENDFEKATKPLYLVSPITNMVKHNSISTKIFNTPIVYGRTEKYANSMYSLPHKISYIVNKDLYALGNGLGGSYIAELFLVGGALAIFIGSSILSILICWLYDICRKSNLILYSTLNSISFIFLSPRGSYLEFVPIFIKSLIVYIFIWGIYIYIKKFKVDSKIVEIIGKINNSIRVSDKINKR
ncbi:O-antigen polysaccharide polymerase Wzy [Clostridium sp.]|uniref:O-antigen polysaccharide polymerase Wzy n=1 Tax=Clostridium sp. TaxID=1506 RepID=UPI0032172F14